MRLLIQVLAEHIFQFNAQRRATPAILERFLAILAEDLVPLRPNRSEPRARKRRPKNYHLLTKPRHQVGNLLHRNRRTRGRWRG